jgi:predicted nucleic acid-binding Zn ribbon protein
MIAARKLFGKTPEFKQTMSEIVTERWSNLNFKNKMSKTKTTLWKDTEFRNKMITSKHKKLGIGICSVCKKEFQKNIHNQKICSKQCRYVQKNNRRNKNKGLCTSLKSHLNIS